MPSSSPVRTRLYKRNNFFTSQSTSAYPTANPLFCYHRIFNFPSRPPLAPLPFRLYLPFMVSSRVLILIRPPPSSILHIYPGCTPLPASVLPLLPPEAQERQMRSKFRRHSPSRQPLPCLSPFPSWQMLASPRRRGQWLGQRPYSVLIRTSFSVTTTTGGAPVPRKSLLNLRSKHDHSGSLPRPSKTCVQTQSPRFTRCAHSMAIC